MTFQSALASTAESHWLLPFNPVGGRRFLQLTQLAGTDSGVRQAAAKSETEPHGGASVSATASCECSESAAEVLPDPGSRIHLKAKCRVFVSCCGMPVQAAGQRHDMSDGQWQIG